MNLTYDKEIDYNFITSDNNVKIFSFSSQTKGCPAENIISNDKKAIWLSETSIPQHIVIDLGNLIHRPKSHFKYFGIYCWHAYATNPKLIELQFGRDTKNFTNFGKYELALKPGTQFFEIKNNKLMEFQSGKHRYLKIIIKETFGGNRTYLNQIYLFEELSGINYGNMANTSTLNSYKVTQVTDRKRVKSESHSLFADPYEEYEEDEQEKAPIEMERSKLIKNLVDQEFQEENEGKEENINNSENPEEEEDYDPKKCLVSNKKLKKLENILKGKHFDKEVTRRGRKLNEKESSEKEVSNHNSREKRKNSNKIMVKNKTKKMMNNSFTFENNYEYKQLEDQLRDMEDHLKSMEADQKYNNYDKLAEFNYKSYSSNPNNTFTHNTLRHSKSFSFLNPEARSSNPFMNNKDYISVHDYNLDRENNLNNLNNLNQYIEPLNNTSNQTLIEIKIQNIEEKLAGFEQDIGELKTSFQKLLDNMGRLIEGGRGSGVNNNQWANNNMNRSGHSGETNINNDLIGLILNECNKMINERLIMHHPSERNNHFTNSHSKRSTSKKKWNSQGNKSFHSNDEDNLKEDESFNKKLNKKIEAKFESLATNIESQIYNNFLKPSISTIEKTMRNNFDDIKSKIKTITNNDPSSETNRFSNESFDNDFKFKSSGRKFRETDREKNLDNKLEEINTLGGKLYEKLLEKEKKLNQLKSETTSYLKKKVNNSQNTNNFSSSFDSNIFNFDNKGRKGNI